MAMDYAKAINELRQQKATKWEQAENLLTEGKTDEAIALKDEVKGIINKIKATEEMMELSKAAAEGAENSSGESYLEGDTITAAKDKTKPFACLGEQLKAVHNAAKGLGFDKRLTDVNNAVLGSSSGVGTDGGFAIQSDFAGSILETAVSSSEILSRVDSYTVGANSNAARWLMIDETDVSASVFGGVQMYWASEGASVGQSKPKFNEMKLDLEKMMGFAYATDELLQDAAFMTGFFGTAFSVAADRLLASAIISGSGAGKPLGILNSKALIAVDKETSQTAATITGANMIKMQARAMPKNRKELVWLMHPDAEEQLPYLSIKQGDTTKFLWNPEGGLAGLNYQTVLNRPVIFDDNCSALGTKGDIILADLKQYMLLKKGTAKQDWSMHVEFLTDQQCFRMVFRCNGAPKVNSALKIKNSTKTRSPFVTLADRA